MKRRSIILIALLAPAVAIAAGSSKSITLPELVAAFMTTRGASPEWSMGATRQTPQISWKSVGVDEDSCKSFASCRRGSVRVSVAGKELQNLRQRLEPVTWEIFMASSGPAKFGPEEISISPSCDTVSCEFDFEKGMASSGITLKKLCHAGLATFRQTAYYLTQGQKHTVAVVSHNVGSGGASTNFTLHVAANFEQQDWCAEARALQ